MDQNHRCSNCGKYPFCENIVSATHHCDKWIKRENDKITHKITHKLQLK